MRQKYLIAAIALVGIGVFSFTYLTKGGEAPSMSQASAQNEEENQSAWSVRCEQDKEDQCEIFQKVIMKESGKRLLEFAIGFPEKSSDTARGVIILPLGMLLEPGIVMKTDEGEPYKMRPRFCDPNGCYVYADLTPDVLESMKKGESVIIALKDRNNKQMNFKLSLNGFTKAFKNIK